MCLMVHKTVISFFTMCDQISSCARIVFVLDFKWLIKLLMLEPPSFVQRSTNCTSGVC